MARAAAAAALLLLDSSESDDEVQPPPQRRRRVWVGEMCKHRDTEGGYYFIGLILIKKTMIVMVLLVKFYCSQKV